MFDFCDCTTILSYLHCHFSVGFEVASWVKAVRAMEILGILLITAAAVCGALKLFAMRDRTLLLFVASGLSIAAGKYNMSTARQN